MKKQEQPKTTSNGDTTPHDPKFEWRKTAFPEVLKTLVEHDSIMRSWIRFLIGIEAAVILAIWALASSSRLSQFPFCLLVVVIGVFGSWMALQLVGVIGRVRQWNTWFIKVVRTMQEDGGVHIFPVPSNVSGTYTCTSRRKPGAILEKAVAKMLAASLWLHNGLRLATDPHHRLASEHTGLKDGEAVVSPEADVLPLPDKSATFRLILAGNTVFLVCLWIAIILLCVTYTRSQPPLTRVELAPDSVTSIVQLAGVLGQISASNTAIFRDSIDMFTRGLAVNSNGIQAQIAELRREASNRSESLFLIVSNRTELLLHSLGGRSATLQTNSPSGQP